MILAFDVGNTETTAALFDGDAVRSHWRFTTSLPRTSDEFVLLLRSFLAADGLGEVDEPFTVGADRIANTLAASRLFKRDAIVVDLGTATTYDCITADGAFIGGIIQPGVLSSAETLFRRTSQLSATEIIPPKRVIGTRTDECIRSGVLYGAADAIEGLVARIKHEWRISSPLVIATGGLAETFRPWCPSFDKVDPFLTLKGVLIGYRLLEGVADYQADGVQSTAARR
jgi:type III pantothenate kinase